MFKQAKVRKPLCKQTQVEDVPGIGNIWKTKSKVDYRMFWESQELTKEKLKRHAKPPT